MRGASYAETCKHRHLPCIDTLRIGLASSQG